jgi:hypothetical protein
MKWFQFIPTEEVDAMSRDHVGSCSEWILSDRSRTGCSIEGEKLMFARVSAFLVALALALTGSAAAQETTGSIAGTITDPQGLAVPGVTVTVTGPQGSRSFVTDGEGRYIAPLLVPGTYTVRAELQGFKTAEQGNVTVGLGSRVTVSLRLETGGVTEVVQVTAGVRVVDTQSTTIGAVLDSATLVHLPVGRTLTDTLYLVPGVSDSSGAGRSNPSIGGGSGLENNYVVDGVKITDTGFGAMGAYNATFGSLGTGVTFDFIKETQVKTGGFEAEYGETTGGVVNVITKSGANQFTGSVFGYARPSGTEGAYRQLVTPNGTVNTTGQDQYDTGLSLGGRIVPNKVFFFGTYNPQWQSRTFIAPEGFPYRSLGDVDRKRRIQSYAGKLTAQLSSSHRLDFSAFGDPSVGESGLQQFNVLRRIAYPNVPGTTDIRGGFSKLEYGGNNQSVSYDAILSSRWLVEARLNHSDQKFHEIPEVNEYRFQDLRFVPQGLTGGLGFYERNDGRNLQYSAKSTLFMNGGGTHELRFGVGYDDIRFTRDTQYTGQPLTLADGRRTLTGGPIQIRTGAGVTFFRAVRGRLSPAAETTQHYTNFFVQDTYRTGRLTVRPGLRWERQYLEGIDPSGPQPDLCFEDDSRPGAGDGRGAAIACNFTWNNWAPRLGATYDLTGTGRAKVFGSWGLFYAKVPNDLAARAMSADTGITRQNYRDAALTQPVANGTASFGATTHLLFTSDHAAIIDPDAGSTYKNEWLAGVEFEVLQNSNLSFRFSRRDMTQILEDIGQLAIAGYFLGTDQPVDYFITNVNAATPVVQCCGFGNVGFEDPVHTYDSFEVTLNRRFAGKWGAVASYRWSRLRGNFEGFFRSDNGQSDPAISSLFDFPTNDPSYTGLAAIHGGLGDIRYQGTTLGTGILPNDRPHQLKLYGNYLWRDINLGLGVNAGSGRALTVLASNPVYANSGEIPTTIRGGGQLTRDGQFIRTPKDFTVDFHADYALNLGSTRRVTLLADIFNLFNRRIATDYDNFLETTIGTLNPNFGYPTNGGGSSTNSFQTPFSLRFGARLDW